MRLPRDFRPQQVYGVTQRGNRGQWVYVDAQDFAKALALMRHYAAKHGVKVHVWSLVHNHGHWVFEGVVERVDLEPDAGYAGAVFAVFE